MRTGDADNIGDDELLVLPFNENDSIFPLVILMLVQVISSGRVTVPFNVLMPISLSVRNMVSASSKLFSANFMMIDDTADSNK